MVDGHLLIEEGLNPIQLISHLQVTYYVVTQIYGNKHVNDYADLKTHTTIRSPHYYLLCLKPTMTFYDYQNNDHCNQDFIKIER